MASAATAVRVGELACQKNSFLRELIATVVSCEPAKAPEGGKGKKAANGAAPPALYDLVLSDSVLFPEGGGQPCDHGCLIPLPDSKGGDEHGGEQDGGNSIPITHIQRRGDTCVLSSPVSIAVGTRVREVVNWERRLDHMQHHTAQHLLTAVVERPDMMFLPTISWSLTYPFCFIQVDVAEYLENADSPYAKYITKEKKICDDMVAAIQDACNQAIIRSSAVRCEVFDTREAYQAEQARREAEAAREAGDGEDRFRSRGIPADVGGPIRVITVDGVDSCTCCGTHLRNLAELQTLHLLHQETKGTTVKLYFITGQRAMKAFGDMYNRERQLMVDLGGSRPEDFAEVVQRRAKDAGDGEKKMKRWALELAAHEGERLVRTLQASSGEGRPGQKVACVRRDDVDIDFFNAVRNALNDAGLQDVVLVAAWATDCGTAAASHAIVPNKDVQGQLLITGANAESLATVVQTTKEVMTGLKGGSSKMGFRGKGSLKEWATLVETLISLAL